MFSSGSYINTYIESEKYQEERTEQFAEFLGIPASNLSFDIEKNADKVSDNNSPEILDINLNKNKFNLADGDQNLSIEVKVKDDLVGVGNSSIIFNNNNIDYGNIFGILTFTGPYNQSLPVLLSANQLTSGDLNEGTFKSTFKLPNDLASGKWNLTDFKISDKNNNIYASPGFLSRFGGYTYEDAKYNNVINREHFLEELALSLGLDQSKLTFEIENGLTQDSLDKEAPSITSFKFVGSNDDLLDTLIWSNSYGSSTNERRGIEISNDDSIFIAGSRGGFRDTAFLSKYDSDGNFKWGRDSIFKSF